MSEAEQTEAQAQANGLMSLAMRVDPISIIEKQFIAVKLGPTGTVAQCGVGDSDASVFGVSLESRGTASPTAVQTTRDSRTGFPALFDGSSPAVAGQRVGLSAVSGAAGRFGPKADGAFVLMTPARLLDEVIRVAPLMSGASAAVGEVIYWPPGTPWSTVLAKLDGIAADPIGTDVVPGAIVMMSAGNYIMDVPANLDRVQLVGMVESPTTSGGTPVTLRMISPFVLLGSYLSLENIVAEVDTTIYNGLGPLRLHLEGSSEIFPGSPIVPIKITPGGTIQASLAEFSEFGGGVTPTCELGNGAAANMLLTSSSVIGDKAFSMTSGAGTVTAGIDGSCVVSPVAFGAGVTFGTNLLGDAQFSPYAPAVLANWSGSAPTSVANALDRIAAKITPIP